MCKFEQKLLLMERRMTGNCHVRCGTGENSEIISKSYLSSSFEMIATAMEGKRLGLHNKSMFVVPNHLTEQIGSDFMKLYPNANILVAKPDDFSPQKRRQMCARIATGNFDAVIIGHSQLIKIPLSAKREQEFIQNQINEITESITATKNAGGANYGHLYIYRQDGHTL